MRTDYRHLYNKSSISSSTSSASAWGSDLRYNNTCHGSLHQSFHIHAFPYILRIFEFWVGLWTIRRKDGTAIFERLDGDFKGIDGLGDIDNLQLIHGHHWTDDGRIGHRIDGLHTLRRLASYLTEAFPIDDDQATTDLTDAIVIRIIKRRVKVMR